MLRNNIKENRYETIDIYIHETTEHKIPRNVITTDLKEIRRRQFT